MFEYFNTIYGILNKEQTILANATGKVKDKSIFHEKGTFGRNTSLERAYVLLIAEAFPSENDNADVFTLFLKGEDVIREKGSEILKDKAKFFSEVTKAINKENTLIGQSLDERYINFSKSKDDYFQSGFDF